MTGPSAGFRAAVADRYAIERQLGAGGMSVVYLARDLKHDRLVALKVLQPEVALGLGAERFVREIRVAAQLQHPHILPLFDSGEAAGVLYYVAPYVEGESLQQRLGREPQLSVAEALAIARQVAGALAYAHSRGIVHRDIKPGNILLEGGEAIVADFGIALAVSAAGGGERVTQTGLVLGTPAYMSPEQAAGNSAVDRRSDIYSLGCVLFEMLTGQSSFGSATAPGAATGQKHATPPPVSVIRPAIPVAVGEVVARAMAKAPADRFDTATAFLEAMEAAVAGSGAWARSSRRRLWVAAASVLVVLGVALAGRVLVGHDAFGKAQEAFARWDLAEAQRQFRRVVTADPVYAQAQLWLAQSAALEGKKPVEWRAFARSAVANARRLPTARDSALAVGLLLLAEDRFPEACAQYRAALARDSLSVLAWFGLGECQRLDKAVVRDRRSTTGWRFRSSYQGAVNAYLRALEIAPSLNFVLGSPAYERLSALLVAEPIWARGGTALAPDTGLFIAYPALENDTLVLVPHPSTQFDAPKPATRAAAIAKGRALLRDLAARWVDAFPGSGRAHAALALALELRGQVADSAAGQQSALAEIRKARQLEPDPAYRVRDALIEIRLDLKLLAFQRARRTADSLLEANPDPDSSSAWYLACAAALTGRAHRTAQWLARTTSDTSFQTPISRPREVPLQAAEAALRLLAYASLGAPVESLPALERQVDTQLRRYAEPERLELLRNQLLGVSYLLAFPTGALAPGAGPSGSDFLSEAQWSLARGDTARARARLTEARRLQATMGPGDLLPVHVYLQASLSAAVHDTAGAEWLLHLSLENLAAAPTMLVGEPQEAATLVRAMALQARLAFGHHDLAAARQWAARVDTLWSGSDLRELRALVDSLRAF